MKITGVISTTALLLLLGVLAPVNAQQDKQEKPQKDEQSAKPATQQENKAPKQEQQAKQQQQQQHVQQQEQQAKQQQRQQHVQQQDQQRQQRQQDAKVQQDQNKQQQQQHVQQQDQQRQQRQQDAKAQQDQNKQQQQQHVQQQDQQRQQHQQDNRSAQERNPAQAKREQVAWQHDRAHSWQSEHRDWQQRGGYKGYLVPDDRFRGSYGQDHGFRIYSLPVMFVGGDQRFQYGGYWFGLVDPWPEYWSSDWYDSDDVYVDYRDDGYYLYNRRYPDDRIAISFYLN